MIKYITLELDNKTESLLKRDLVTIDQLLKCFKVQKAKAERVTLYSNFGEDGSRYIIMNNDKDIVVGVMSSIAKFQCEDEYHFDLEAVFFKRIRQELGFERKY